MKLTLLNDIDFIDCSIELSGRSASSEKQTEANAIPIPSIKR